MDASQIITEDMTLEEKLSAIEKAMQNAQTQANEEAKRSGSIATIIDPADLTICDGCQ